MNATIQISAKCSDLFDASLSDEKGVRTYDGYVPEWFGRPEHFGDYVQLRIDLETGQILNWKKPTKKQLEATFGK